MRCSSTEANLIFNVTSQAPPTSAHSGPPGEAFSAEIIAYAISGTIFIFLLLATIYLLLNARQNRIKRSRKLMQTLPIMANDRASPDHHKRDRFSHFTGKTESLPRPRDRGSDMKKDMSTVDRTSHSSSLPTALKHSRRVSSSPYRTSGIYTLPDF